MWEVLSIALALSLSVSVSASASGQIPEQPKNLRYFPEDMPRPLLIQKMREFSFALGVRCQHCHAGGDGVSFEGVAFDSDEKLAKRTARFMLRMVDRLNGELLRDLPGKRDPAVRVTCVTCHRGLSVPRTLAEELTSVLDEEGVEAAIARYAALRENTMSRGLYDFGEWSINELARELREAERLDEAIAMLEMNGEYYPESVAIDLELASLHESKGEVEEAVARYRRVLEKSPGHERALERLEALGKASPRD